MPDVELKPQVYKDPRPKEYFDQFHARVRRGPPGPLYDFIHALVLPYVGILFRARALKSENVPGGPVILAPNHASFVDHFFAAAFIRRRIQFMGKSQLFKPRVAQWIFSHGGVFPVRRGYHDEEAFVTAFHVLGRGGAIIMYCEGGRSRTGKIGDQARPGIGRLALESGAPVVPVAILGSYQVRNWRRGRLPRVTIRYGEPLRFERVKESTREQQQEVADHVLEEIRALHGELERAGHRGARRALAHQKTTAR
jgi:1-acyl-sn-glycerol-3-phosphate acyltransferase